MAFLKLVFLFCCVLLVKESTSLPIQPGINCGSALLEPTFLPTEVPISALNNLAVSFTPLSDVSIQNGDFSMNGDLPIGGTIRVSGYVPVYGMVAVDGAVPSAGSAVVDLGCLK